MRSIILYTLFIYSNFIFSQNQELNGLGKLKLGMSESEFLLLESDDIQNNRDRLIKEKTRLIDKFDKLKSIDPSPLSLLEISKIKIQEKNEEIYIDSALNINTYFVKDLRITDDITLEYAELRFYENKLYYIKFQDYDIQHEYLPLMFKYEYTYFGYRVRTVYETNNENISGIGFKGNILLKYKDINNIVEEQLRIKQTELDLIKKEKEEQDLKNKYQSLIE